MNEKLDDIIFDEFMSWNKSELVNYLLDILPNDTKEEIKANIEEANKYEETIRGE